MALQTIDKNLIKQNIDLRELAGAHAVLRRESAKELAGPCPKCAGEDRFHVTATSFFCRLCHPKWGDAIEFVTWLHGVSFKEAAAMLTGGAMPQPTHRQRPEKQAPITWDEGKAVAKLDAMQRSLWDSASAAAHDYLLGRGLDGHTWQAFGLGYRHGAPLPNTWDKDKRAYCYPPQAAIALPWHVGGRLVAIRYRMIQAHTYTGIGEEEPRTEKQNAQYGSAFAGHLFGGQALTRYPQPSDGQPDPLQARTLVICEGEINCMSIWQAAHETKLDVLSLGSESQKLPPAAIAYAQRYRLVILWADREEIAEQLQTAMPGAYAVTSAKCGGMDANDLLQAGKLGLYLSTWRFDAARDKVEQQALLFDLWDAARAWHGLDDGSAQVMQWIAQQLGKDARR